MKLLYFHQHFGTPEGSTGTRSYEFARALVGRGHRVTLVCGAYAPGGVNLPFDRSKGWARGDIDGLDVIELPLPYSNRDSLFRRTGLFLRFAMRSTRIALSEDYDVLFATSTPLTAGIPGIAMKLFGRGKPFVFEVRDLWPELPRALGMKNPLALWGMEILEWLSYHASDACVGLSPGIVAGIESRSQRGHRVAMIPNGSDLELFKPGCRENLRLGGIDPRDFAAVFTGAHGAANGLDAVLDAAAELKRRGRTGIKLVFIGDGREKDLLVARARHESLSNCFFLAPMKKAELARLIGCFDCGLMILKNVPAFYFGTSPNKFFDYLSAGLPILTNYPGWLAGLIAEHECGLVVPPNDPVAFADALCFLADESDRRRSFGENARRLAEQEFGRERLAVQFVDLIEEVGVDWSKGRK